MTIDRDDLLSNDLLDDEMDKLFNDTAPFPLKETAEAGKDLVTNVFKKFQEELTRPEEVELEEPGAQVQAQTQTALGSIDKSKFRPDMSMFDDYITRQLMENTWEWVENEIGGGYNQVISPELLSKINFVAAEKLPHREFVSVLPTQHPHQRYCRHPEIDVTFNPSDVSTTKVEVVDIEAKSMRYNTRCTPEYIQDLRTFHNGNAVDEAAKFISEELLRELNKDMMDQLRYFGTATTTTANAYEQSISSDDLMTQIMDAAACIEQANRKSTDKWVIMSPALASMMISDPAYRHHLDTQHAKKREIFADFIGDLYGMKVYVDNNLANNELFVGNKGDNRFGAGITYHPHNLAIPFRTVVDPASFEVVVPFYRRDSYHVDELAAKDNIHHITFKREATSEELEVIVDPNCVEPKVTSENTLIDIDVPYGPQERLTLASIFKKENNP